MSVLRSRAPASVLAALRRRLRADDDVPLAEAEALRHVEAAMPRPGARARDLLSASVPLERPPDPSALFELRFRRHRALPALRDPSPLSVLSYNVGLLSRAIPIERFEVPEVAARREVLPEILLAHGWGSR